MRGTKCGLGMVASDAGRLQGGCVHPKPSCCPRIRRGALEELCCQGQKGAVRLGAAGAVVVGGSVIGDARMECSEKLAGGWLCPLVLSVPFGVFILGEKCPIAWTQTPLSLPKGICSRSTTLRASRESRLGRGNVPRAIAQGGIWGWVIGDETTPTNSPSLI